MGDLLSQDEINTLMGNGINGSKKVEYFDTPFVPDILSTLTEYQVNVLPDIVRKFSELSKDVISAALNQNINVENAKYAIVDSNQLEEIVKDDNLSFKINYNDELRSSTVINLSEKDAIKIFDLMSGGNGQEPLQKQEVDEMVASAVSEAINQIAGINATVVSDLTGEKVDILPPSSKLITAENFSLDELGFNEKEKVIVLLYTINVGDVLSVNLKYFVSQDALERIEMKCKEAGYIPTSMLNNNVQNTNNTGGIMSNNTSTDLVHDNINQGVNIQNAQFQELMQGDITQQKENISLIMDVPLEITVEMGRTSRNIKEILEFVPGTIIELNKLAGDPIDILVNGKFIGKGEVVVIDENYGIRVTEIINKKDRI